MGQTQILMIVLSVIIVGISVAVGISQFGETAVSANQDAVVFECRRIMEVAHHWYRRPTSMGGGGRSFNGLTLTELNTSGENDIGFYNLGGSGDDLTIIGEGKEQDSDGNVAYVTVTFDAASGTQTGITIVRGTVGGNRTVP